MTEELIERLRITEQMLNVAHFKEAESLIREACDAIEELQSKLTASRRLKKGKWRYYDGMCSCSVCESHMDDISPFCPMCGADMREEKNNDG